MLRDVGLPRPHLSGIRAVPPRGSLGVPVAVVHAVTPRTLAGDDVRAPRSAVLHLDEGSGVRRLAPMAARYRERQQETASGSANSAARRSACVEVARLAEAIWHVLTPNRPFAPAGRPDFLAA